MLYSYSVCIFVVLVSYTTLVHSNPTSNWVGTAGDGNWATAGNWDNGVPDVSVIAHLPVGCGDISVTGTHGPRSLIIDDTTMTLTVETNSFFVVRFASDDISDTFRNNWVVNGMLTFRGQSPDGFDEYFLVDASMSGTGTLEVKDFATVMFDTQTATAMTVRTWEMGNYGYIGVMGLPLTISTLIDIRLTGQYSGLIMDSSLSITNVNSGIDWLGDESRIAELNATTRHTLTMYGEITCTANSRHRLYRVVLDIYGRFKITDPVFVGSEAHLAFYSYDMMGTPGGHMIVRSGALLDIVSTNMVKMLLRNDDDGIFIEAGGVASITTPHFFTQDYWNGPIINEGEFVFNGAELSTNQFIHRGTKMELLNTETFYIWNGEDTYASRFSQPVAFTHASAMMKLKYADVYIETGQFNVSQLHTGTEGSGHYFLDQSVGGADVATRWTFGGSYSSIHIINVASYTRSFLNIEMNGFGCELFIPPVFTCTKTCNFAFNGDTAKVRPSTSTLNLEGRMTLSGAVTRTVEPIFNLYGSMVISGVCDTGSVNSPTFVTRNTFTVMSGGVFEVNCTDMARFTIYDPSIWYNRGQMRFDSPSVTFYSYAIKVHNELNGTVAVYQGDVQALFTLHDGSHLALNPGASLTPNLGVLYHQGGTMTVHGGGAATINAEWRMTADSHLKVLAKSATDYGKFVVNGNYLPAGLFEIEANQGYSTGMRTFDKVVTYTSYVPAPPGTLTLASPTTYGSVFKPTAFDIFTVANIPEVDGCEHLTCALCIAQSFSAGCGWDAATSRCISGTAIGSLDGTSTGPQWHFGSSTCAGTSPATAPPTSPPTKAPTDAPTRRPTAAPTDMPTKLPTRAPSTSPTPQPTVTPGAPSRSPTPPPTKVPTSTPTKPPSRAPTTSPTRRPTEAPLLPGTPTASPTEYVEPPPSSSMESTPSEMSTSGAAPAQSTAAQTTTGGAGGLDQTVSVPLPLIVGVAAAVLCLVLCLICLCLFSRRRQNDRNSKRMSIRSPHDRSGSRSRRSGAFHSRRSGAYRSRRSNAYGGDKHMSQIHYQKPPSLPNGQAPSERSEYRRLPLGSPNQVNHYGEMPTGSVGTLPALRRVDSGNGYSAPSVQSSEYSSLQIPGQIRDEYVNTETMSAANDISSQYSALPSHRLRQMEVAGTSNGANRSISSPYSHLSAMDAEPDTYGELKLAASTVQML